jgi:hypothetical protein
VNLTGAFIFLAACAGLMPGAARAAEPDPAAQCARIRDDDTIRPYAPAIRAGLLTAYAKLFPQARTPAEAELQAGAHIRCMDGNLLACFTGANLPCAKLNTTRVSIGADAYCHSNPDADFVPAYVVGHDTAYVYRCVAGKPSITGGTFPLDARGFAAPLWAPMN